MPVILNGEVIPDDDPRAITFRRQQNIYHSSQQYRDSVQQQQQDGERLIDQSDGGQYTSWQEVTQDPFAASMMMCFLCLAVVAIVFLIWLFYMELNVGIWSLRHHVECDRPLAIYLIGEAMKDLGLFLVSMWFVWWVYRNQNEQLANVARFEIIMIIWCGVMLILFSTLWLVFGNVWLFSSKTCKNTSKNLVPPPKKLMYNVYEAASLVVLINDMTLMFKLLDGCIRRCTQRASGQQPHDNMPLAQHAAANLIFTPSGAWHWASAVRSSRRNVGGSDDAFSGDGYRVGSRDDYPNV